MNSVMITGLLAIMPPLGPLRHLFTKLLALIHSRKLEATVRIVQPIVETRLEEMAKGAPSDHVDAIQWAIELAGDDPVERDPRRITLNTLQNIWAGSAGPAVSVTQMLYQVLMMPEYLEPLAREAHAVIEEFGWTDKAMNHMPLLDSFIRECNRMYPLGAITAARTVMDDKFTFHDGLTFPKGTRFAFAIGAIQKDERFIENPETFDGFRFADKKNDEPKQYMQSASTVSPNNLVYVDFSRSKFSLSRQLTNLFPIALATENTHAPGGSTPLGRPRSSSANSLSATHSSGPRSPRAAPRSSPSRANSLPTCHRRLASNHYE